MISNVQAGNSAYLQQINSQSKKETAPVSQTKELDRVESLKEQIQNGDYKIDINGTAEAIAQDLI